jgi:iron complex outermembrane receptor protein
MDCATDHRLKRFKARLLASCFGLMLCGNAAAQETVMLPGLLVTGSRIGTGITGASTSVITAEEIGRSPSLTVQDILSREPGVQVQNLFGGVNGARSTVDLRGFGATAASNTLILVNGRRVNDVDSTGFDIASIPRESIERIEITRGNSAAVLYGDGAVGGVINIVTKSGVALPPRLRIDGAFGSFGQSEGNISASGSKGPFSGAVFANAFHSDGYRDNNDYRQYNGVGDFRYGYDQGSLYLNLSADKQHVGLPGGRLVDRNLGIDEVVTNPRGAATPFDFANKEGANATAGIAHTFMPGVELIVDGGVRWKQQHAEFFGSTLSPATIADPTSSFDATLRTWSVTPRLRIDRPLFGLPWKAISGIDWYRSDYNTDRGLFSGAPPIHHYDLTQTSLAAYSQHTLTLFSNTDISAGGRIQQISLNATDALNPNAPGFTPLTCFPPFGCFGDTQGLPLDQTQTHHAFHVGAEHRLIESVTLFGRHAQSFRVPNVDERIAMAPSGTPTSFDLRTQISHDVEAGVRLRKGIVDAQWSAYDMRLTDEIHFSPATFTNTNLDPTRRRGHETIVGIRVSDDVRIKAGYAFTRATFREGPFAGNDVPLVSRHTGSAGLSWNIYGKWLVFDGVVRYVGNRRMDNDERNVQPLIPAFAVVDVRLGGEIEKFFWAASVQNLTNERYFDYAVASAFTLNRYNAYPQPGRTFLVRAGMNFGP